MMMAILAGGLASRMGALTGSVPKYMLPVGGEPFAAHQLRLLARGGVDRVHLCLGHLSESILEYVGDGRRFGVSITSTVEKGQLLGTAGALALARDALGDYFGVMYGDSYLPVPFARLVEEARRLGTTGVMTVWRNENRFDRSNLVVSGGKVEAYSNDRQDPRSYAWIDYGLSFLHAEAIRDVPGDRPTPLSSVWKTLVSRDQLGALPVDNRFYEIGSRAGYAELCAMAQGEGLPVHHE